MKSFSKFVIAATMATASLAVASISSPAQAKGCGGYVNVAVWGCAPWDNNPPKAGVTPGYKPTPAPVVVRQPTPPPSAVISQNNNKLISQDGGGIYSPGVRNGVISNDGGSFVGHNGSALVGNAGGTMRAR